ncbi:tyrosine-protein kinase hopscotch isoform X2 [Drosophila sulfurigaster albostrigata]|uniref:tyrosine-protein kinase hopscotch isoform X2 n=1 Tax=Drosophila sulfurigaster albostrigata TaxID=89887 RepID=UPI002D21D8B5|nr:tyrosine-protein kinase hopscotch isoform X2 [Drosophila sulfurigaster albostrigata]
MDDSSSGRTSLADSSSLAASSLRSGGSSSQNIANDGYIHVYNFLKDDYDRFAPTLLAEEISCMMCRQMEILPAAQLLFGIREHNSSGSSSSSSSNNNNSHSSSSSSNNNSANCNKWQLAGEHLSCNVRYCFRMRFRVPELDRQLSEIDANCHTYLYHQMRYDMLHEQIQEIRYPDHKDKVMGLAVMDMLIDKEERQLAAQAVEKAYKTYLPRSLWRAHRIFVRAKIRSTFRQLSVNQPAVDSLKWHYVHQICHLAPTYLTEQFKATVEYFPNESTTEPPSLSSGIGSSSHSISHSTRTSTTTLVTGSNTTLSTTVTAHHPRNDSSSNGNGSQSAASQHHQHHRHQNHQHAQRRVLQQQMPNTIPVYVRLWFHDSAEPGLKVARVTSEATLKWSLVAVVEDIFSLYKESEQLVRMEIVGFPKGYHMRFETEHEMKSFISYLGIYIRLTVKWMQDLCPSYKTPSLEELDRLCCHGPIGGGYSFMKLHENGDKCGSYIVRQCDREYNTYYIDINTRIVARNSDHERCQTETFKIVRKEKHWKLAYNGDEHTFDQLPELAQFIRTDSNDRIRIPPSKYDKPPLLLLCLPKNLKTKKTEMELSEGELQRRNAQIFNPKTDLQWYRDSINHSDDDKVFTMRGDWIQQGSFKDVPVTMKMLKYDANFQEFTQLAHTWSLIQSPQFIKLYGLTLSVPYTMVMEYSKYGPLNKFLLAHRDLSMYCLLDVMHGLVRGMHYLEDNKIIHSYIRCANLYVTKYEPEKYVLDAKISDPGYPRPYKQSDSAWIPIKYYNHLEAAKQDSSTQLWAFATTIYEIFSRGQCAPDRMKQRDLIRNRSIDGGILKPLHQRLCPTEMYNTIMDGWSDDPEKRFSHHDIFTRLNAIKTRLQRNYDVPETETEAESLEFAEDGDYQGEFMVMNNGHGQMANGRHESECEMDEATARNLFSGPGEFFSHSHDLPLVMQLSDCKVIYREKHKIGQGHYGTVYRGELEYHDKERPTEQVAIKKLKTVQVTNDFIREIDIMRKLDHPNVVKFKYWAEKSLSIIMEYFEYGSFIVYLSSRKPSLTNARLLAFALDIAQGMNYLSGKGLIHRDLAARNILVDRSCVKISDFGLAQFANADGYYYGISQRDIPIKWYSPEAIETCKFSSYSDVWSYGVTLFEMFSRGEIPNLLPGQELTQEDFLNRLRRGERLPKPELCTDFVYNELMRPCWHETPKSRPSFYQIIQIIQSEIGDNVGNLEQQQQQPQPQQQQQQLQQHHRSGLEDE